MAASAEGPRDATPVTRAPTARSSTRCPSTTPRTSRTPAAASSPRCPTSQIENDAGARGVEPQGLRVPRAADGAAPP